MRFERDELHLSAGVRHGRTLGSPVGIEIFNSEWAKWEQEMSPEPGTPTTKLTKPRPGHADFAGMQKYASTTRATCLERASARETAARVAAGALGQGAAQHDWHRDSEPRRAHRHRRGAERRAPGARENSTPVDESEVRCFDADSAAAMIKEIKAAAKEGDSLGGIVEVIAYGVPVGLGSHVHWDRKLDGLLAGALMSIHAVKAVEIGDGMSQAAQRGSVAHDAIAVDESFERGGGYIRRSDHAGGLEGGMSSGAPIIAKVAMKPFATLNRPVLETVDVATKRVDGLVQGTHRRHRGAGPGRHHRSHGRPGAGQ
jgi:chorismate synthase